MTPEQTEYAQRVAIAGLIGGLGGALIGQFASTKPTLGKTALGSVLGAGLVGAGYGVYLRSGGVAPGQAAGLIGSVLRYPHMRSKIGYGRSVGRMLGKSACGSCASSKTAGYEIARKQMLGSIGALRGTYTVTPGT